MVSTYLFDLYNLFKDNSFLKIMDLTEIVNELVISYKAGIQLGAVINALDQFNKEYNVDEETLEQTGRLREYLAQSKSQYEKSVREYSKMLIKGVGSVQRKH
jgi:hypothetical protein